MKTRMLQKAMLLAVLALPAMTWAADWYEASGKPVQRSLLSSADLRTEFSNIESNISDKLPALTGNGGKLVAVNSGGTALEAVSTGVAVASGGTGATTAAGARTNLGLEIGTDVLAYDAEVSAIAALAVTDGNIIVGNGSTWVAESGSTARTSLGVAIGSDVQAYDADLATLAGLAKTNGNFIVGNGTAWVAESGSTARSSLGLGSLATLSTISNSNWSGADLALANGGTGSSLSDPGADRIMFWDDSAGTVTWLTAGNELEISGTSLAVDEGSGSGLDADTVDGSHASAFASSSHNHSASDITSGTLAVGRGGTGQTTMDNVSEQVTLQWTIQSDPGGTPTGSPGDVFAYY